MYMYMQAVLYNMIVHAILTVVTLHYTTLCYWDTHGMFERWRVALGG